MSAQRLSDRAIRRIERATGVTPIVRGWAHGDNWYYFITPGPDGGYEGHQHGEYNMKTAQWSFYETRDSGMSIHYYPTCSNPEGWAAEFNSRTSSSALPPE